MKTVLHFLQVCRKESFLGRSFIALLIFSRVSALWRTEPLPEGRALYSFTFENVAGPNNIALFEEWGPQKLNQELRQSQIEDFQFRTYYRHFAGPYTYERFSSTRFCDSSNGLLCQRLTFQHILLRMEPLWCKCLKSYWILSKKPWAPSDSNRERVFLCNGFTVRALQPFA